ncbi:MAG: hypothetical protein ABIQ54_03720 [Gammaproteobacteria bacterium]
MNKNINPLLAISAALMLVSLTACGKGDNSSDTPAATGSDPAMSDNSAMGSNDAHMSGNMVGGTAQISVTNPMPHEMTVSADTGQGPKELGSVKPGETKTFDVSAAAGSSINLVATDAGKTHSPSGTVTVESGQPATWTIQ